MRFLTIHFPLKKYDKIIQRHIKQDIEDTKTFNGATCTIAYTITPPDGCQIDYDNSTFNYSGGQGAIESANGSIEIPTELDTYEYSIELVDRYGRVINYKIVKELYE